MGPKLEDYLNEISIRVESDANLIPETKQNIVEAIAAVSADPTPDNLDALAILLDKMQDATKYISALRTMKEVEATSQHA